MNVVTQAFVGHLGDLELAAVSIAKTVNVALNLELMVMSLVPLLAFGVPSFDITSTATVMRSMEFERSESTFFFSFGAERHYILGIYLQRSFIVMFMYVVLMLPLYIFATPILKLTLSQSLLGPWLFSSSLNIFAFVFLFSFPRFLQHQSKNIIIVWVAAIAFTVHCVLSWLLIYHLNFGLVGAAVSLNIGWWLPAIRLFLCIVLWWLPSNLDWFFKRSNYKPL
ncbi:DETOXIFICATION 28 protein [Nymphaea thermarum]|nr:DETOXIFICATION 28 protein [Nymphaea thermarum]